MPRRMGVLAAVWAFVLLGACAGGSSRSASGPSTSVAPVTTAVPSTTSASVDAGAAPTTAPPATAAVPAVTATSARATTTVTPAPGAGVAPVCPPIPTRATPRRDGPSYVVTADVDVARGLVTGTVDARFTPDVSTDQIVLRLWPNSPNQRAAGVHLDPGPLTVDGQIVPTARPDPTTLVSFHAVPAGRAVAVSLPWTLTLTRDSGERNAKAGDSIRLGSFFPLLPWEYGHGWMTDPATTVHGEASGAPTADFDLTVTVPSGYGVVATGTEDRPGHWSAPAVEDLGVAIGHFRTATATASAGAWGPVAVKVVADAAVADDPAAYAAKAVKVIDQYNRRFGPYPWPSYTLAITSDLTGGIEYPMFVHTGPGAIGRSTSHEIGHQYFYGVVQNDQGRDPWIDEGLASWAEAGYEGTLASFRSRAIPAAAKGHTGESTPFWDRISSSYYDGVYVQGVQALDALGPHDKVDCALALYVARNAYRIARPADVIDALSVVFPDAATVLARYGIHA